MAKAEIDISQHRSKSLADLDTSAFDLVVMLCADEICPNLPGRIILTMSPEPNDWPEFPRPPL